MFPHPHLRQPACQTVFTTASEENGLITAKDIHKASRGGNEERVGFRVRLWVSHVRASDRTNVQKYRKCSSCSVSGRGCGSRKQSGVSVLIHPLGPDQIQWRATKDDVTIPQLSQPLSVAPPNACVCVKGSDEVKLDALSPCISLSLILSSLQTRGIQSTVLKAVVWIGFPPRVCVSIKYTHFK